MADPTTTNILLAVPTHGSDVDTWDVPVNANSAALDGFQGGMATIGVTSGVSFTLTVPAGSVTPTPGPTQAQNAILRFTGAIASFVQAVLPLPGYYIIDNRCTGAGLLTISSATVTSQIICISPGGVQHIYNSGSEVNFVNLQPVGSYLDVAGSTVPTWITASTKPPFLLCDGSTFSAVTYPALATVLGGTTLPDFRGRAPYYLNSGTGRLTATGAGIDGNTVFAAGGVNGVTLAANQVPSLTSSGNNTIAVTSTTPLTLTGTIQSAAVNGGSDRALRADSINQAILSSGVNNISVTYTNAGQQIVGNAAPGVMSGLRLIRAA